MLDVMAPGSANIWTTALGGEYNKGKFGGTSAAAPFVSGLAALILSVNPDLTPDQVESIIKNNAVPLDRYGEGHPNGSFGWGRIDAYASVANTPRNCYLLATNANPDSSGAIMASPVSSPGCPPSSYATGTIVTLSATPSSGYNFVSWSRTNNNGANPTTVTMNGNRSVTANFGVAGSPLYCDTTPIHVSGTLTSDTWWSTTCIFWTATSLLALV